MIPYALNYCEEKIKEYKQKIKENQKGNFIIKYSNQKEFDGYLYENKEKMNEAPIELFEGDKLWMRISPHEIQGAYESIKRAKGKVGVLGLGLGYFVQEISKKEEVEQIVVYEMSEEIIELYLENFGENTKIKIVKGDGFKAQKESFDFFYSDIYEYKISTKVVDDYVKLAELHDIKEYSFFGVEAFILSCPTSEIIWVYILEEWMDMAKDLFTRFNHSKYIEYFSPIKESEVLVVLKEFGKVL
ncbi:hypothetical protein [Clostridium sp. B9]|uniref:hypothetical protein n=1 Tax=Clostridium sp. B9 TaxID=3423224 RepID=UPI003D2EC3EE